MSNALISILVVSAVAAFLAALLVVAERFIANYGEVEIDINAGEKAFTAKGGNSLLETLKAQKIFIPSACGGRGTCAYCKVTVKEGAGPLLPTEEPYLDKEARAKGIRLSCQVKVRANLKIEIPSELFSIKEYEGVCERIIEYTYDTREFRIKLVDPPEIAFKAGQYVQFLAPSYKGSPEEVYRAYSISSDPVEKGFLELIVRRVQGGICTTYMFDYLKQSDKVRINGPYGEFFLRDTGSPIVFIAGGSGIAPIKSIIHNMVRNPEQKARKSVFFFGVRTLKDLYLVDQMSAFEKELPDYRFVPVVSEPESPDWKGERGRVTDVVKKYLEAQPDVKDYEGYLCGSPGMIDSAIAVLTAAGIPLEKIYYDKFS